MPPTLDMNIPTLKRRPPTASPRTLRLAAPLFERCLVTLLISALTATAAWGATDDLATIQIHLDAGNGQAALELLLPMLRSQGRRGDVQLAYSTALFLTGDAEGGEKALRRAVDRDPTLLQGWLNLGGVLISKGEADEAVRSFEEAQALAPSDPDISLNLGTALLLSGRLDDARGRFDHYLEARGDQAEDHAVVAQNYALANALADATRHAAVAISKNERLRLDMRTDPRFARALDDPAFQRLLATDTFEPDAGSLSVERSFEQPYETREAKMIGTVIDALKQLEIPFDPRIEATANWALIWTERFRLKLSPRGAQTQVTIIAPPRSFTRAGWEKLQTDLWGRIEYDLAPKLPAGIRPPR